MGLRGRRTHGTPVTAQLVEHGQVTQRCGLAEPMCQRLCQVHCRLRGLQRPVRLAEIAQDMSQMGKGFCQNPGLANGDGQWGNTGQWSAGDTSRLGNGSGGAGQGNGASPDAKETSVTFNNTKANVNTQQGPIIGSRMVYEGQIRGESRVEFAQSAEAAAANASDAIESMRVPREYEAAVMKYFGALREKAEPAKDASEDKGE